MQDVLSIVLILTVGLGILLAVAAEVLFIRYRKEKKGIGELLAVGYFKYIFPERYLREERVRQIVILRRCVLTLFVLALLQLGVITLVLF